VNRAPNCRPEAACSLMFGMRLAFISNTNDLLSYTNEL
jgi:hypothetical protein